MEFRATFPLSVSGFDLFGPSFFLSNIVHFVPSDKKHGVKSKTKTDEYFVLPGRGTYNVKFGEGGSTFDVKFRRNDDVINEDWLSVAKGALSVPGSVACFISTLRELVASSEGEIADALVAVANHLDTGLIPRVFTRKTLTTLSIPVADGIFTVEQIDFSIWPAEGTGVAQQFDGKIKKPVFRSVSLEGRVPEGVQDILLAHLRGHYGDSLILGGFPFMVEVALNSPSTEDQFFCH